MRRRPTASDRDVADALRNLPRGRHAVLVEGMSLPPMKIEGGVVIDLDTSRATIIPEETLRKNEIPREPHTPD